MTFPINYHASVSIGLTFMDIIARYQPKWLAKDFIVVFYDDAIDGPVGESYSKSIKEFLDLYYLGQDKYSQDDNLNDLLNDDRLIHGRCGYIRQGFPFIFKDISFNTLAMHVDGVNSKLSDIDYVTAMKGYIDSFKVDV